MISNANKLFRSCAPGVLTILARLPALEEREGDVEYSAAAKAEEEEEEEFFPIHRIATLGNGMNPTATTLSSDVG